MRHNPTQQKEVLRIDGAEYFLLFDFEAIAEAEEIADRALLTGLQPKDISTPKISFVRAMLFGCLHARHPDLTFAEVKSFVRRDNLAEVWGKVMTAWMTALKEPEGEGAMDPMTDQD